MRTARRFVNDESGMTMALAVIMIVLLGVMGAGLLTFVSRDLNTVTEENRGQRAFEVADAGVQAAKRQLASGVDRTVYNGNGSGACGSDDIQWSALRCDDPKGLTLNNLDGEATTSDSVNVTIEYKPAVGLTQEYFRVISTGTYGNAKRKIEAIFKGVAVGSGGNIVGHPLYFTPGSISIDGPNVNLNSISMFAGGDILIEGDTTVSSFLDDYESASNGETLRGFNGKADELCDWKTDTPSNPTKCFVNATGPYNTYARQIEKNGSKVSFEQPGLAAEGTVCGFPDNGVSGATPPGTCGASVSIADGVYAYDQTTGAKTMSRPGYTLPWGNNRKFEAKTCNPTCPANTSNQISYPFPRPTPVASALEQDAVCQNRTYTYAGSPPDWDNLFRPLNQGSCNGQTQKVVFVDAGNRTLHFQTDNAAKNTGLLVVWCGRLEMDQNYSGIILNLVGDNLPGHTPCTNTTATRNLAGLLDGHTDGTYRNNGLQCQCWNYAQGGTTTEAGIEIGPESKIDFYQADWSFLNSAFTGPPPTSFALEGWRELYS